MNNAELNRTADIGALRELHQKGLLSDDAFTAACAVLRPGSGWVSWARRMLLFHGSALVLAGVVFFFAYNWASMGKFLKFGLIEGGIIVCVIASRFRGSEKLGGKVLLLSGSVLVGVLLAVYGQIYQTGADAFELFIGWAVLISGWVIVSEFAALWMMWLVLLNTGAILYWLQVGLPAHSMPYEGVCLALAALDGAALALREAGLVRGREWLKGRWTRFVLLAATLAALSLPAIHLILDFTGSKGVTGLAAIAWAGAAAGGYVCYRFKLPDMIPLALVVMNSCIIGLTLIGKILFYNTRFDEGGLFLLFGLIILGVVSGAVVLLRKTAAAMANETRESAK